MRRLRRATIAVALAVALLLAFTAPALADTSQDVTVTATPTYISISNSPNTYDFGAVEASGTPNTTTGYFTITNDSTVNIEVTIVCNGWSGTTSWTYGAPGADTGQLKASDGDGAYDVTVDDTTPATLATTSSPGDSISWELQLDCPTSFSHGAEQTTTVTIAAAAS